MNILHTHAQRRDIYTSLIDAFEEYRYTWCTPGAHNVMGSCVHTSMQKLCVGSFPVYSYTVESMQILQARTRHLSYLSADLDSGNVCPACPKVLIKG